MNNSTKAKEIFTNFVPRYYQQGFAIYEPLYFENIQTEDYMITKEEISSLVKSSSNLNLSELIDQVYEAVMKAYQSSFPESFIIDSSLNSQIKTELLLDTLTFLSTQQSAHFLGWYEYSTEISYKDTTIDVNSYTSKAAHLSPSAPMNYYHRAGYRLNATNQKQKLYITHSEPQRSDYFLEGTPLIEYLLSHVLSKNNSLDFDDIYARENKGKENALVKYQISKEGYRFTNYILLNCDKLSMPYTRKSEHGLSSTSLNSLFSNIWKNYRLIKNTNEHLERLLFFINSENIFHLTYTEKLFSCYSCLLSKYKDKAAFVFGQSLKLIDLIQNCPLTTLKLNLIERYLNTIFDKSINNDNNLPYTMTEEVNDTLQSQFKECGSLISIIQEMTNCFYYTLFSVYGFFIQKVTI